MTALRLEFFKTKRRGLWMIVGALILCEMAWLLWAFRNPDAEDLRLGWMLLLYNIPLLNGIIFPLIAAVLASRLADLEHKSCSLKLLETVQSPRALFTAKYLCGATYVLAVNLIESAVLLGMGAFYGFEGPAPLWAYGLYFLFGLVCGLEILALQLSLSLCIKNQMVSLCIGCGGSFSGLLLMFLPQLPLLRALIPWGHIGALMFVGLRDWNPETRIMNLYYMPIDWPVFALTIAYLVIIFAIGRHAFARKEV